MDDPEKAIHGQTYRGVVCQSCQMAMRIHNPEDELDEKFWAMCPKCGHEGEYRLSDIRTLVAHRKQ